MAARPIVDALEYLYTEAQPRGRTIVLLAVVRPDGRNYHIVGDVADMVIQARQDSINTLGTILGKMVDQHRIGIDETLS